MKSRTALALCMSMAATGATAGDLSLLTWEGYADPSFTDEFTKETGCVIHTKYVGSGDEIATALLTGRGDDYDMVAVASDIVPRLIDAGTVDPIDMSKVPNVADFHPQFQHPDFEMKDGKQYGVPYAFGIFRYAVDMDKMDAKPDSLAVLFDPKYKGQVALWDDLESLYMAARYLGFPDAYNMTPEQLTKARDLLISIKPNIRRFWYSAGELTELYNQKEITMSNTWETTLLDMRKAGRNVVEFIPKERRGGWIDSQLIVKRHSSNPCTYEWLAYSNKAEVTAKAFKVTGFFYANSKTYDNLDADGRDAYHYLGADKPDALDGIDWGKQVKDRGAYLQAWNEVKAATN